MLVWQGTVWLLPTSQTMLKDKKSISRARKHIVPCLMAQVWLPKRWGGKEAQHPPAKCTASLSKGQPISHLLVTPKLLLLPQIPAGLLLLLPSSEAQRPAVMVILKKGSWLLLQRTRLAGWRSCYTWQGKRHGTQNKSSLPSLTAQRHPYKPILQTLRGSLLALGMYCCHLTENSVGKRQFQVMLLGREHYF